LRLENHWEGRLHMINLEQWCNQKGKADAEGEQRSIPEQMLKADN